MKLNQHQSQHLLLSFEDLSGLVISHGDGVVVVVVVLIVVVVVVVEVVVVVVVIPNVGQRAVASSSVMAITAFSFIS